MSTASKPQKGAASVKRRYEATVSKGANQWRREWAAFMTNVRRTEGGSDTKLPKRLDILAHEGKNDDGIGELEATQPFSYLFASSQGQRNAERKRRHEEQAGRESNVAVSPSKMQQAVAQARRKGLQLETMKNRKERRAFLLLTRSKEAMAAEERGPLKPQDLMDPKLQWYQQQPYPLDVIAEKLVCRKALKHAKQMGLKYNYLTVHPSWLASRKRRRTESNLVPCGSYLAFAEDGEVTLRRDAVTVPQRVFGQQDLLLANRTTAFISADLVQPNHEAPNDDES